MKKIITILISLFLFSCNQGDDSRCECVYPDDNFSPIQGIPVFRDLSDGIACAMKCNKPILLFFNAWVVMDRMRQERMFGKKHALEILKNDYVVVCLFVDDRTELPDNEKETWYLNGKEKIINTVGKRNRKYQIERFNTNAQPWFVILSEDGKEVIKEFGYTKAVDELYTILTKSLEINKTDE